jgi:hypothetical protein
MNEQHERLNKLVERIEKHQKSLKLNDTRFVARYQRFIGSSKTWRDRLCAKDWKEFGNRLGKWDKKLTAFVTEIDGGSSVENFFNELPIAKYGAQIFEALQGTKTDRRCGMLLANYGCGKTWVLRKLAAEDPTAAIFVSANPTWKESPMQIASGLARVLGVAISTSTAGTFKDVIEYLKGNPITVMIDEAHEGGVILFKLVKTLINETQAKFILGSYPTAWNRLVNGSTDAHSEAQQLIGRTLKPINTNWFKGLNLIDVEKYLQCSTELDGADCRALAERILADVRRCGNFRVLADAVELAANGADVADVDLDAELIEEAVRQLTVVQERK